MARKRAHGEGTIFKRQDGTWQGDISLGFDGAGKRKRRTVYGATQSEVREKLEEIKRRLAENTYSDTRLTLAAYLDRWLEHVAPRLKPRTIKDYRYLVRKYIVPQLGRKQLAGLKPLDIQAMVDAISKSAGPRTANACRTRLFSSLKQALRWELIARNPVDAVATVPERRRQQIIWTPEESVRFLTVAASHRLYALFYLVMSTGLRHGEALNLCWDDILHFVQDSVQGSVLYVRDSKTAKGIRRVTLAPDVLAVLERHKLLQESEATILGGWPANGLVFTSEVGTALDQRNISRLRHRLEREAGVRHATLHDLRHLNVSIRRKLGQDAKVIADQIGHTNPAFTQRLYTHLFEDDREAAGVNLAAWSGEALLFKPKQRDLS